MRLADRREIDQLFRRGARVEQSAFVLLYLPLRGRQQAAFTAGRRLGGSVMRNRARRRLREAYRRQQGALLPGRDVRLVFVARRPATTEAFPEIARQMTRALRRTARAIAP
jgi:ribonuclease P protein component